MQKTLRLEGMNWHNATNPKLKEGKVRELNPEICPVFFAFSHFGRVFAESGDFLTFLGDLSTGLGGGHRWYAELPCGKRINDAGAGLALHGWYAVPIARPLTPTPAWVLVAGI